MGEKFYHLSPGSPFEAEYSVEAPRTTKQSKRGAQMVGLYTYPESVVFGPDGEAIQKQYGKNIFEVRLRDGAKVVDLPGNFTRVTPEKAEKLRKMGVDAVRFSSPETMGRQEVVIISNKALTSNSPRLVPPKEVRKRTVTVPKPTTKELAKKGASIAAKRGGRLAFGAAGVAADYLTPAELGDATLGGEFESAEHYRKRKEGGDPTWLRQQPGYEQALSGQVMPAEEPPWADPGWYKAQRGERDLSPEGVRKAREAAAKRALEKET